MADTYHFQVGDFDCFVIKDCDVTNDNPGPRYFVNAPQDELAHILRRDGIELDQWKKYSSTYNCMAIRTDSHFVLIDTGNGITTQKIIIP